MLAFGDSLVFRLVQRVDLGGAVGAFDLDMLQGDLGQVLAAQAALVLPPEEATTDYDHQQQQADAAQDVVRQTHRLFDPAQEWTSLPLA